MFFFLEGKFTGKPWLVFFPSEMGWVDLKDHYDWVDIPKDGLIRYPISTKLPWQFGHFLFFAVFFTPVSHCPVKRVELVVVHSIPASLPGHAAQAALHSSSS